jgi:hypothetical protein
MTKDPNSDLWTGQKIARDNLESLRVYINTCVEAGMIDFGDELYNTTLALIDDCGVLTSWDELFELVERAKVLEKDIDVWLALHGRTTLSLPWPTGPSNK